MCGYSISKDILENLTKDFVLVDDSPNKEYLEKQLFNLTSLVFSYRRQSENIKNSPIERARARDHEQNCIGLISGIKFAISFLDHQSVNLLEYSTEENKSIISGEG